MNGEKLEAVLARLYTDEAYRVAFLESPAEVARAEGLDATDIEGLASIDRDGLELTADSYARKRQFKNNATSSLARQPRSLAGRLWAPLARLIERVRRATASRSPRETS